MEEAIGDDKMSNKGENGHNEIHSPSLAAPFKKAATMTLSLFSIILFIGAYIVTRWGNSNVVSSCSARHHISFLSSCLYVLTHWFSRETFMKIFFSFSV